MAQIDLGRVLPSGNAIHVAVIGDFGTGSQQQENVAQALRDRNNQAPFQLGLTVGDNFYRCGVRTVFDRKWTTRWENFYTALGISFYATLGNHDYGHPVDCIGRAGSPDAQVAYTAKSKSWRMPARYYTFAAGPSRFFALDTESWGPMQMEWLKAALEASQREPGIRWRIIYGHHPVISSGHHANQKRVIEPLREQLGPLLKNYRVDLYISGHDHSLERLAWNGTDFLIAGGGGAGLRFDTHPRPESRFASVKHGFLDLTIDDHRITAQFYDSKLQPLEKHPFVRSDNSQ